MSAPLRVGVSACIFHNDPSRPTPNQRTLLYLDQALGHWLMAEGFLAFLVPTVGPGSRVTLPEMIGELDGLILQGGVDVAPQSYGERPLHADWAGDPVRDAYEIALVHEALAQKKPVLGICRGAQLLNVALGGSLYQDIPTQLPGAVIHRHPEICDQLFHNVRFERGSRLQHLYPDRRGGKVNSLHHQALKRLGRGLKVEARAEDDGVIEAVRLEDASAFAYGFQWHPEFHDPTDGTILDARPILHDFIERALARR